MPQLSEIPGLVRAEDIRVWLDRDAILSFDPDVTIAVGTAAAMSHILSPPWFFIDDSLVRFDAPNARNHTMDWVERHSVLATKDDHHVPSPLLALPCYRIPGGALSIDGNHRFLTTLRHTPTAPVVTLTIEGPLDPAILPDLAYWID